MWRQTDAVKVPASQKKTWHNVLLIALGGALFLFIGDGALCFFRAWLGVPCPGCGMTRAYFALFRGDIGGAFFYHPLFAAPMLIALVCALHAFPSRSIRWVNRLYASNVFWGALLALIVGVYIVRMILFFPHTPPMDFNGNCVLMRVLRAIGALLK